MLGCGDAKPFLSQPCVQPLRSFPLWFVAEADERASAVQNEKRQQAGTSKKG